MICIFKYCWRHPGLINPIIYSILCFYHRNGLCEDLQLLQILDGECTVQVPAKFTGSHGLGTGPAGKVTDTSAVLHRDQGWRHLHEGIPPILGMYNSFICSQSVTAKIGAWERKRRQEGLTSRC